MFWIIMAFTTSFLTEWASNESRVIIAKLTALVDGASTTLYVSTEGLRTDPGDTPADELIHGGLDIPEGTITAPMSGFNPWSDEGGDDRAIELRIFNHEGLFNDWADYNFRNQVQELYLGFRGDLFTDYERILKAVGKDIRSSENFLYLPLQSSVYNLTVPLQSNRFSGEANEGINGRPKPIVIGSAKYVPPALVDSLGLVFQAGDGPNMDVDAVFADGFELVLEGQEGNWDSAGASESGGVAATWLGSGDGEPKTYFDVVVLSTGYSQTVTTDGYDIDWTSPPAKPIYVEHSLQLTHQGTYAAGSANTSKILAGLSLSSSVSGSTIPNETFYVLYERTASGATPTETSKIEFRYKDDSGSDVLLLTYSQDVAVSGSANSFGISLDVRNDIVRWHVGSDVVFTTEYQFPSSGTDTVYGYGMLDSSITTGGAAPQSVFFLTGYFDNASWVNAAAGSYNGVGLNNEWIADDPRFNLVYNPQGSKITAHVAAHSPQGFESWSAPDGTISGADSRTIEGKSAALIGHILPMPRSFGDLYVEIECDSVNNANSPEIGLTSWNSTDTIATRRDTTGSAHRNRAALWADGGAFRINGTTAATVGGGFATASTVGIRTDRDNNALYLYEDGVELGGGSSPFTLTDMIRDPAKDDFTATDYYELDDGEAFADSADTLTIAMRINVEAGTANRYLMSLDANVVRLFVTATEAIRIQTRDSSPATITDHQTSALSGWVSVLMSLNAKTGSCQIYVDDVSDVTTTVGTGGTINWNVNECDIGAATAGVLPLLEGEIQLFGVATGVAIDFSVEENRRRFFRDDGYPSELAGYDGRGAFGKVPEVWIVDGDATANRGSKGPFTEIGTVGDTDAPGDRYAPITPIIVTNAATDRFTVRTNSDDMTHFSSYGGATAWGERWSLGECVDEITDQADSQNNFQAVVNSGFAPPLGYYGKTANSQNEKMAIIDWLALSCGFFTFWDRDDQLRVAAMQDPEGMTSSATITRDNHVAMDEMSRNLDSARLLTSSIGGYRIWSPHRSNEIAAALDLATSEMIQQQSGIISVINSGGLDAIYDNADIAEELETLLQGGEPLDATVGRPTEVLGRRGLGLYTMMRGIYQIPKVQREAFGTNDIEPGKCVTVVGNRWGFAAGKKLLVLGFDAMDRDAAANMRVWG